MKVGSNKAMILTTNVLGWHAVGFGYSSDGSLRHPGEGMVLGSDADLKEAIREARETIAEMSKALDALEAEARSEAAQS